MTCDKCEREAVFTVTAAYHDNEDLIHPTWATYPRPMATACIRHLADIILIDAAHPGATPAHLVRVRG